MKFLFIIFSLLLLIGCSTSTYREERVETPETIYLEEDLAGSNKAQLTEMEKTRSGPSD